MDCIVCNEPLNTKRTFISGVISVSPGGGKQYPVGFDDVQTEVGVHLDHVEQAVGLIADQIANYAARLKAVEAPITPIDAPPAEEL